jgi:hypothetical protein
MGQIFRGLSPLVTNLGICYHTKLEAQNAPNRSRRRQVLKIDVKIEMLDKRCDDLRDAVGGNILLSELNSKKTKRG